MSLSLVQSCCQLTLSALATVLQQFASQGGKIVEKLAASASADATATSSKRKGTQKKAQQQQRQVQLPLGSFCLSVCLSV